MRATAIRLPEPERSHAASHSPAQLAKAKEEAKKFRDNWHRAEADFQNYKRRTEQERDESRKFANVSVIINLLPVLDDFERAFSSLDSRLAGLSWFDGIYLIYRKLQQLLENSGVTPIQTEGQVFDPRFHEAVAHAEGEDGKVISEVQRGYKLHDRVLRPAMVVVGKGRAGEQGTGNKEQGTGNGEQELGTRNKGIDLQVPGSTFQEDNKMPKAIARGAPARRSRHLARFRRFHRREGRGFPGRPGEPEAWTVGYLNDPSGALRYDFVGFISCFLRPADWRSALSSTPLTKPDAYSE